MRRFTVGKVLDEIFWLIVAPTLAFGLVAAVALEGWTRGLYGR